MCTYIIVNCLHNIISITLGICSHDCLHTIHALYKMYIIHLLYTYHIIHFMFSPPPPPLTTEFFIPHNFGAYGHRPLTVGGDHMAADAGDIFG